MGLANGTVVVAATVGVTLHRTLMSQVPLLVLFTEALTLVIWTSSGPRANIVLRFAVVFHWMPATDAIALTLPTRFSRLPGRENVKVPFAWSAGPGDWTSL